MLQFLLPPFLITCTLLLALIIILTVYAPAMRCKRMLIFPLAVILAGFSFSPLFHGVVLSWQAVCYGERHYQEAGEIRNPLIQHYLPASATNITLLTGGAGHYARYNISEADFHTFLNGVWEQYRIDFAEEKGPTYWVDYSEEEIQRELKGTPVDTFSFPEPVKELNWAPLQNTVVHGGPRRNSSAGATYWFDRKAGVAFHNAGYW